MPTGGADQPFGARETVVRTRTALAVVAGALIVAVISGFVLLPQLFGNGVTVTSATTPSARPSPAGPGLLQTSDLDHLGPGLQAGRQRTDGRQRLTACTGRQTMSDLVGHGQPTSQVSAIWRGSVSTTDTAGERAVLRESVARGASTAAMDDHMNSLIRALTDCTYSQHGRDRRLGKPTTVGGAGSAVRLVAYDPDGTAVGGVGVFHSGTDLGVLELLCAGHDDPGHGDPGRALDSLTADALRRIR